MNSENKTDSQYSIGIFQYKFRNETPTDRIERLDQKIKKIDKKEIKLNVIINLIFFINKIIEFDLKKV